MRLKHGSVRWFLLYVFNVYMRECVGFPGVSVVKNLPASAGDVALIPGSGRSSGEGNGGPLQCSCLGIPWTEEPAGLHSMWSQRVRHD